MREKAKYQKFCCDLQKAYIDYLSGEGDSNQIIFDSLPSEKLVIGVLDSNVDMSDNRTFARTMPIAKIQFFSDLNPEGELSFKISGNLFYNVLPTYAEEQEFIAHERQKQQSKQKQVSSKADDLDEKENNTFFSLHFRRKFQRVRLSDILPTVKVKKSDLLAQTEIDLSEQFNTALRDPNNFPNAIFYATDRSITLKALDSETQYNDYIRNHSMQEDSQIIKASLRWQLEAKVSCKITNDKCVITFTVRNVTETPENYRGSFKDIFADTKYPIPVYNIGLQVSGDSDFNFSQIALNNFVESYKVDSDVYAKGEWLTAKYDPETKTIHTENAPVFKEYRVLTRDEYDDVISFKNLQQNPEKSLQTVLEGMEKYYQEIESQSKGDNPEYQNDLDKFLYEKQRFETGIELLKDPDFSAMRQAFVLMNQAFAKNAFKGWRLFQLVFIVSMIPDILYHGNESLLQNLYNYYNEDTADIIYYPTGGGKTEAFLGTVALSMFYDRLIGKEYGVNSILKYPLRLLSIQQLERTLKMIINANAVLEQELPQSQPFSLGYFVGGSNTPNHIDRNHLEKYEHNEEFTLVKTCPYDHCDGAIDLVFNPERQVLEHRCQSCHKVLPLYIVDEEIYRYVPTVIISTVDKFAAIASQDGFRNLLGGATKYCKKHGFCLKSKKCSINASDPVIDVETLQNQTMVPSFLIQDEIHLLKESLGVFSAHYESLVDEYTTQLLSDKNRKAIKHIGATATISGADYLVRALYNRECIIFPSPSTHSNGDTFYSYRSTQDLGRIIIGFAPYGDSITARAEYSISTLRILLDDYYHNAESYCSIYDMSANEFRQMVYYYWTTIIYFLSKRDSNDLRNTFEQQANLRSLSEHPDAKFNIAKMTGDETFSDIKSTLQEIETEKDKRVAKNLVLATSTISHGVDSKEFNDMFFFGIPSNTAEYIQSYSRVGRFYTGIVVDIIRLMRTRDISFLKYFDLYHKYKEYLIDETDLNIKSILAIERTFPGIFLAIMRHYFAVHHNHDYDTFKSLSDFLDDESNRRKIFAILCRVYRCADQTADPYNKVIQQLLAKKISCITTNVDKLLRESYTNNTPVLRKIDILTEDGFKAMTSLRNIDVNYEISLAKGDDHHEKEWKPITI